MQRTIQGLRESGQVVFVVALLSHIATGLGLNLEPDGRGIKIPFKDGDKDREVYIAFDYITEIKVIPFTVTFISSGKRFRLSPDTKPPVLEEELPSVDGLEGRELWANHRL